MKHWFLFSLLVAGLSVGFAKSGSNPADVWDVRTPNSLDTQWGPDQFGYIAKDSNEPDGPDFGWIDISTIGTPVSGLADDNFVGPFNIGWTFRYYWYDVSTFSIGSNGWMKFSTAGQLAQPIPQLPNSAAPNDVIAPYAADWFFGPSDPSECFWWTNNVDTLIISWENVTAWAQGGNLGNHNFQMILSGADSSITFQYGTSTTGDVSNNNIAIGIENLTGGIGISNFFGAYPANSTAIKFYYPETITFQVHDLAMAGVQNPGSQGVFILTGETLDAWMRVRNAGNQQEASYTANYAVRQTNNTLIVDDDYTGTTIAPAGTQDIEFPGLWSPSSDGVFRLVGTVTLTGDLFTANNTVRTEIHAVTLPGELLYDDGLAERTWSWAGGEGGMGMGFVPPVYPCEVISVRAFVGELGGDFQLQILDDDGANGGPGTILWSTDIVGATPNAWASATVPDSAVIIADGEFFAAWYTVAGSQVTFGIDSTSGQGISRRSWENAGGWAENRLLNEADVMVRVTIREPGQVNNPPVITAASPLPDTLDTVCFNRTIDFSVLAEDPDGQTLDYQWVHNGNNVGTNSPTYSHRFITLNQNTLMCRVCDFEFCDSITWTPWVMICSDLGDEPELLPTDFVISAFPNPFNPTTTIDFSLPQRTEARVVVHNLAGQEVAVLQDGVLNAGVHRVAFDGANLASGTYFAVLKTPTAERITKLLLLK
ncbi:MAG: T9SS type A sorting domain-containing protein [Calditrichaeota bacterium]|nr:T9SS type A sorting domain-containing protein [Calditrichota bacterium]MCB9391376.1 T9SS type A sorting domain-containing protein [Calditrichota bacterium]